MANKCDNIWKTRDYNDIKLIKFLRNIEYIYTMSAEIKVTRPIS